MFSYGRPVGFTIGAPSDVGYAVSEARTLAYGLNDFGTWLDEILFNSVH